MTPPALTVPDLETVYDLLAGALDQVGPDKSELFLVKLALLHADALADPGRFRSQLQAAAADL